MALSSGIRLGRYEIVAPIGVGGMGEATMAAANRTWGEERIANELLLKLGIRVSPRTVRW